MQGYQLVGLEQTARSVPLQQHVFARKTVLVLGKERDGISEAILQVLKLYYASASLGFCCILQHMHAAVTDMDCSCMELNGLVFRTQIYVNSPVHAARLSIILSAAMVYVRVCAC